MFAYRHPDAFDDLIQTLVKASSEYLIRQFKAGVDAVQIFDTWAGILPPEEFARWCIAPVRQIILNVRDEIPDAKIIAFPRGAGSALERYVTELPIDAVGLDWMIDKTLRARAHPEDEAGAGQSRSDGADRRRPRAG